MVNKLLQAATITFALHLLMGMNSLPVTQATSVNSTPYSVAEAHELTFDLIGIFNLRAHLK
jgi:hypothetical protein